MNAADITVEAVVPAVGFAVPTAVLPVGWVRLDVNGRCTDPRGFMLEIAGNMVSNHLQGVTDQKIQLTVAAAAYVELVRLFSPATAQMLEGQCFGGADVEPPAQAPQPVEPAAQPAGMDPEDIKAELRKVNMRQSVIAKSLGITDAAVYLVIHGETKSRSVASVISKAIGRSLDEIWPGVYPPDESNPGFDRLCEAYGVQGPVALARAMRIHKSTAQNWVARGPSPEAYRQAALETGRTLDWLILGKEA